MGKTFLGFLIFRQIRNAQKTEIKPDNLYTIIDIETTGGSHKTDRITEIAIITHDGKKVVNEYSTLVNPERTIPPFITGLTGISNEMVAEAPKFYEVAKEIIEITENQIFVAHNANFDYNFIKEEFRQLGFNFQRDTLCTVKLSRRLLPGHPSYSLGKLCDHYNIQINGRHRAAGDAIGTAKLFDILLDANGGIPFKTINDALEKKHLNPELDVQKVRDLPEKCGVYYFYNSSGSLIYIGKSKNIRSRVLTHLGNTKTKKGTTMASDIADIDYEITGSELVALLKESAEIKYNKPLYNRAQRRSLQHVGIFKSENEQGYYQLEARKIEKGEIPITSFDTLPDAKRALTDLCKKFKLCQKLCGLYDTHGACFHYQIHECNGACVGAEFPFSYNMRVEEMIASFKLNEENVVIIEEGRNSEESAVIWIENGAYYGFGFFDHATPVQHPKELKAFVKSHPDNKDVQKIIRAYLKANPKLLIENWSK